MNNILSTEAWISLNLLHSESNGSNIVKTVQKISNGKINILSGSLYPKLRDMEIRGLIEKTRQEIDRKRGGLPKDFYKLTLAGVDQALTYAKIVRDLYELPSPFDEQTPANDQSSPIKK